MRRVVSLGSVLVVVAVIAAGCGLSSTSTDVPTAVRAPPQMAHLSWLEPYPAEKPALVFGVSSFTVTRDGWIAEISVENRSKTGWEIGDAQITAGLAFGVMLFPNDDLGELEDRNRSGDLPAIRPATTFSPELPSVLGPGATWRGKISAPGALAGGLWVRLSFGPFTAVGEPPAGAAQQVVWFTDHAYRLAEVAGEPA